MTEENIIQTIVKELKKYPDIKFNKKNDSELKIFGRENTGFDILLQLGGRDNMLHFGINGQYKCKIKMVIGMTTKQWNL